MKKNLCTLLCLLLVAGTFLQHQLAADVFKESNRMGWSADGNQHDPDDWGATGMVFVLPTGDTDGNSSPKLDDFLETGSTEPASGKASIDLSHWKLTLPVDAAGTTNGKAAEISAAQLTSGFKSDHFHTDSDGAIVFKCPVNGATTEGTQFPRSELREMLDPSDPSVNWMSSGTHILEARCRVIEVPSNPKVIIGQIHSYSGKSKPLIKLQYYKGRVEALVKLSPTSGKDRKLTFPDVGLNSDIAYRIKLQGGVLSVTVNGVTQTENVFENDADWANQTFYFKAGAYPQDNDGPASEGAQVAFSVLNVSHTGHLKPTGGRADE